MRTFVWTLCGFLCQMYGPGVPTPVPEECLSAYYAFPGHRPSDFDGDDDVDLHDFAIFQNGFNGENYKTEAPFPNG